MHFAAVCIQPGAERDPDSLVYNDCPGLWLIKQYTASNDAAWNKLSPDM